MISPSTVSGLYGVMFVTVLGLALTLVTIASIARSGGTPMTTQRRSRLYVGAACLIVAAIVGIIGYLKLSLEPDVNRQIPYLASSGMVLVILAAIGAACIVGEQMRTDEKRLAELETAVTLLSKMVSAEVEAPARLAAPAKAAGRQARR
ncbi:MAG: hypothetical protein ACYDH6_24150 [Acidimicrobiales bacterium]